jgi:hypothetical protein
MKDLKKLAILLRALGFKVEVINEKINYGDGIEYDNIFADVDLANCHWNIWHEDRTFEVHFYWNNECVYDQVYYSFQFDVIKQIFVDYDKYGK